MSEVYNVVRGPAESAGNVLLSKRAKLGQLDTITWIHVSFSFFFSTGLGISVSLAGDRSFSGLLRFCKQLWYKDFWMYFLYRMFFYKSVPLYLANGNRDDNWHKRTISHLSNFKYSEEIITNLFVSNWNYISFEKVWKKLEKWNQKQHFAGERNIRSFSNLIKYLASKMR